MLLRNLLQQEEQQKKLCKVLRAFTRVLKENDPLYSSIPDERLYQSNDANEFIYLQKWSSD